MTSSAMNPITEDDIADFLLNTPDFFGRHAEPVSYTHLVYVFSALPGSMASG